MVIIGQTEFPPVDAEDGADLVNVQVSEHATMDLAVTAMSNLVSSKSSDSNIVEFFYARKNYYGETENDYSLRIVGIVDKV